MPAVKEIERIVSAAIIQSQEDLEIENPKMEFKRTKNDNIKKEEEHKIFVRRGTNTYSASKHDIEMMFFDRKNIIPDYEVEMCILSGHIHFE